jgi:hypothetical protein
MPDRFVADSETTTGPGCGSHTVTERSDISSPSSCVASAARAASNDFAVSLARKPLWSLQCDDEEAPEEQHSLVSSLSHGTSG